MTMTNEQNKLVEQLVASVDEEQIMKIRDDIGWSDSFISNISAGEVEFYLTRLLITGYYDNSNRKKKQEAEELRLAGQRNNVEGYMAGLLAYVRKQLPKALVSFESGANLTKLEVLDSSKGLHLLLFFDKKDMTIKSVFTTRSYVREIQTEDISTWNAGVAGHEQSYRFVTFRNEIEEAAQFE